MEEKVLAIRGMEPDSLSPNELRLLRTMLKPKIRLIRREDPSFGPWNEEFRVLNVKAVVTFTRKETMRIRIFGPEPLDTIVYCHPSGLYTVAGPQLRLCA